MNNKIFSVVVIAVLLVGIFTVFLTVLNAESSSLFCSKKQNIIVTLKNEANVDKAKEKILEIPQVRIIKIQYRDKEWSKMVNKMDLPKMENPFKNEFTLKTKGNTNMNEIYNKIKTMDFVEDVKYVSDTECLSNKIKK